MGEEETLESFLQEKITLLQQSEERWARSGELQQLRFLFLGLTAAQFTRRVSQPPPASPDEDAGRLSIGLSRSQLARW